jgi:hypothetical protein
MPGLCDRDALAEFLCQVTAEFAEAIADADYGRAVQAVDLAVALRGYLRLH